MKQPSVQSRKPKTKRVTQQTLLLTEEEIVKRNKEKFYDILGENTKIKVKTKNDSQLNFMNLIEKSVVTFCSGTAGCGKTYLTLASALTQILDKKSSLSKIYLIKSVTTVKGEELGFLPGDLDEKINPYLGSYLDNMNKIIGEDAARELLEKKLVDFIPIAYLRGRTLDNAYIIVDESQNLTSDTLKTILTRIGNNSKMVVIGDKNQVDLKNKFDSALIKAIEWFEGVEGFGSFTFSNEDNVRNPIINLIEDTFLRNGN
jgi:phosphate starvation-inducible protein PhoH and related proteins